MPTIALALWISLLGRSTGHAILHVDLAIDRGTTSVRLMRAAVAEASAIWAPYGIDVREVQCASGMSEHAIRLNVVVARRRRADTQEGSIGSIEFADSTPRPNVSLYVDDVRDLVTTTLGAATLAWPSAEQDDVDGRALGRALAHEIGHYLLRTRQHARSGLMRANQPVPALLDRDRRRFFLTPAEVVRLDLLHAASISDFVDLTPRVTVVRSSSQSNTLPRPPKSGGTTSYE